MNIAGYRRTLPNGRVITVRPYDRSGKEAENTAYTPQRPTKKNDTSVTRVSNVKSQISSTAFTPVGQKFVGGQQQSTTAADQRAQSHSVNREAVINRVEAVLAEAASVEPPSKDRYTVVNKETEEQYFDKAAYEAALSQYQARMSRLKQYMQ